MVRDHGRRLDHRPNVYWDLRWNLQDGGERRLPESSTSRVRNSLVVAQNGGSPRRSQLHLALAEFDMDASSPAIPTGSKARGRTP